MTLMVKGHYRSNTPIYLWSKPKCNIYRFPAIGDILQVAVGLTYHQSINQ